MKVILRLTIRSEINWEYLTTLKIVWLSTKLYYFTRSIYSEVIAPIKRLRDAKTEKRGQGSGDQKQKIWSRV